MFELNRLYNMDCMEAMRKIPDKYFQLAIVDPPYGGGGYSELPTPDCKAGITKSGTTKNEAGSAQGLTSTISAKRTGGTWSRKYQIEGCPSDKDIRHWDVAPPKEYFNELARISVHQIIWGGNYFDLPPTRCFLIWEKQIPENFSMAMCEYAWTSFNDNAKIFSHRPQGTKTEVRFHPTQKPIALYEWIISKYAKDGDRIIDTHAGSGSCCIAAHRTRHEWLGFEIDEFYFEKAKQRIEQEQAQMSLFDFI